MKKTVMLLLVLLCIYLATNAQTTQPKSQAPIPAFTDTFKVAIEKNSFQLKKSDFRKRYFDAITELDKQYYKPRNPTAVKKDTIYIDPQALDSGLYKIFATVVIDNENLVKNGTAASISQDKDKATLSFNYSKLSKNQKIVGNFGLYGSSTGNIAQFYSAQSWQKNIGLTAGITFIGKNNKRSFNSTEARDELNAKRRLFYGQLKRQYQDMFENYSKWVKDSIDSKKILDSVTAPSSNTLLPFTAKQYEDALKKYDSARIKIKTFRAQTTDIELDSGFNETKKDSAYRHLVREEIKKFDIKNADLTGYLINWWAFDFNGGIGSNKLYNDTVKTNDSVLHLRTEDFVRARLTASWNISSYQKYHLSYFSASLSIANTNFLENRKIGDIPNVKYDPTLKKLVYKDTDGKSLGTINDMKNNVIAFNPGLYFCHFPGESKVVGFEINLNGTVYANKPKDVEMKNLVNATAGLLLRVNNTEAISKATIGLSAGIINGEQGTHIWESAFGMQLKVGVPFKVLFK